MVAVLKVRPAEAPACDNSHIRYFPLWMRDNEARLREYYLAIGGKRWEDPKLDNLLATARAEKFLAFMRCRWDIERMRDV